MRSEPNGQQLCLRDEASRVFVLSTRSEHNDSNICLVLNQAIKSWGIADWRCTSRPSKVDFGMHFFCVNLKLCVHTQTDRQTHTHINTHTHTHTHMHSVPNYTMGQMNNRLVLPCEGSEKQSRAERILVCKRSGLPSSMQKHPKTTQPMQTSHWTGTGVGTRPQRSRRPPPLPPGALPLSLPEPEPDVPRCLHSAVRSCSCSSGILLTVHWEINQDLRGCFFVLEDSFALVITLSGNLTDQISLHIVCGCHPSAASNCPPNRLPIKQRGQLISLGSCLSLQERKLWADRQWRSFFSADVGLQCTGSYLSSFSPTGRRQGWCGPTQVWSQAEWDKSISKTFLCLFVFVTKWRSFRVLGDIFVACGDLGPWDPWARQFGLTLRWAALFSNNWNEQLFDRPARCFRKKKKLNFIQEKTAIVALDRPLPPLDPHGTKHLTEKNMFWPSDKSSGNEKSVFENKILVRRANPRNCAASIAYFSAHFQHFGPTETNLNELTCWLWVPTVRTLGKTKTSRILNYQLSWSKSHVKTIWILPSGRTSEFESQFQQVCVSTIHCALLSKSVFVPLARWGNRRFLWKLHMSRKPTLAESEQTKRLSTQRQQILICHTQSLQRLIFSKLKSVQSRFQNYFSTNKFVDHESKETYPVQNPYDVESCLRFKCGIFRIKFHCLWNEADGGKYYSKHICEFAGFLQVFNKTNLDLLSADR